MHTTRHPDKTRKTRRWSKQQALDAKTTTRHQMPQRVQTSSSALGTTSDDMPMPLAPIAACASPLPLPSPTTTLPPSSPSRTTTPPVAAAAAAAGKGGVLNADASAECDKEVGDSGSDDEAETEDEEEGGALSSALARRTCMDASSIGTATVDVGDLGAKHYREIRVH
jgi:hypothetical protein